jgi:hypothetical protein
VIAERPADDTKGLKAGALGFVSNVVIGVYYRHELVKSAKNFVLIGIAPVAGGIMLTYVFVKSCIDLADPANSESGNS